MRFAPRLTQRLHVQRVEPGERDALGDKTPGETREHIIDVYAVAPTQVDEPDLATRDALNSWLTVYAPLGVDIRDDDRVQVNPSGPFYPVVGDPVEWHGARHPMRRVRGTGPGGVTFRLRVQEG